MPTDGVLLGHVPKPRHIESGRLKTMLLDGWIMQNKNNYATNTRNLCTRRQMHNKLFAACRAYTQYYYYILLELIGAYTTCIIRVVFYGTGTTTMQVIGVGAQNAGTW